MAGQTNTTTEAATDLKYFRTPQGQWLQFGGRRATFDRYYESSIAALDLLFYQKGFTPQQAKEYLTQLLDFGTRHLNIVFGERWYADSVQRNIFGERVNRGAEGGSPPIRELLNKYNSSGLVSVAQLGLHLLKGIDGGIETKIVENPTDIACECAG